MPRSQDPPPASPGPSKRSRHGQAPATPLLPEDVVVEQILTRVPAAATVRLRAVCRAWRAALTSDHFVQAHRAVRAAAGQAPEIVFFAPAAGGSAATKFYSFKLTQQNGSPSNQAVAAEPSASARELMTVEKLRAHDVVLSGTRPSRGLTLLLQRSACAYHVCNLSTGEHVALPPCAPASVFSSAGLGFDEAAGEHKVVRLFEDDDTQQQRCEVFGLRSSGWRPCAGQPPPYAARGLDGSPPVFLDGCFYWYIDVGQIFADWKVAIVLSTTPERILSLAVGTEQFGSVPPPEKRAESVSNLVELDGSLCAVVDARRTAELYELWTLTKAGSSGSSPSWWLRCRISLESLPAPMRDDMGRGIRMIPLGTTSAGKILLATSRHMVYAYNPESDSADRVFSMQEFVDAPQERLLLNVALHEESVAVVRHRPAAAGGRQLKVKLGRKTIARRGGPAAEYRDDTGSTPQWVQRILGWQWANTRTSLTCITN